LKHSDDIDYQNP